MGAGTTFDVGRLGVRRLVKPDRLIDVIIAENNLQQRVQLQAAMKEKIASRQKTAQIDVESQLAQLDHHLKEAQKVCRQQEQNLYERETMLCPMMRKLYDSLREGPAWYLRRELVKDCIARGGCCSRQCKCCAQRHLILERGKSIGHCTDRRACCISFRGCELTESEIGLVNKSFKKRLEDRDNPAFLWLMLMAFFAQPESSKLRLFKRLKLYAGKLGLRGH